MTEEIAEFAQLVSAVQLEDVRLIECSAKTYISKREGVSSEVTLNHGARVVQPIDEEGLFILHAGIEGQIRPRDETDRTRDPSVALKVVFELSYRVPKGTQAKDAALQEFAKVNGVFNAWPYCREFIQGLTTRMGLPAVVIPVFRISRLAHVDRSEADTERPSISRRPPALQTGRRGARMRSQPRSKARR